MNSIVRGQTLKVVKNYGFREGPPNLGFLNCDIWTEFGGRYCIEFKFREFKSGWGLYVEHEVTF